MKLTDVLKFAGELDAIKFYVEILTGLTFALIVAVAFATWKVSDREVKIIEKTLRGEFERKFDELNDKIDRLTTVTEKVSRDGIVSFNGWKVTEGGLKRICLSNASIYQLDITIKNDECLDIIYDIVAIPTGIIDAGKYSALEEKSNQWVTIFIDEKGWIKIITPIKSKSASLKIQLSGHSVVKHE